MTKYPPHPLAAHLPMMTEKDLQDLANDIKTNGLLNPIVLYEGKILDGRNRDAACKLVKIEPRFTGYNGSTPVAFVWSQNIRRRHLTADQKGAIAIQMLPELEAENRAVKAAARKDAWNVDSKKPLLSTDQKDENRSTQQAAALVGTSIQKVNEANKLRNGGRADLLGEVAAGTLRMKDALTKLRLTPKNAWRDDEQQRRDDVESGASVVANQGADQNLIAWAEKRGCAIYIGRGSVFGNPFVMGQDGDRKDVCRNYAKHYLPHKPSILGQKNNLRGKVLICHCYPEQCHGDSLLELLQ